MSNEITETIGLQGFDQNGEPEIRREASGSMWLVFNCMPPSWLDSGDDDMGPCEDFDIQLQQAIESPVLWEDREFFYIENPQPDTTQRIQMFLAAFREAHEAKAKTRSIDKHFDFRFPD